MLAAFIIVYLIITLFIGIYAARLVKNGNDFTLAGRQLPVFISASAFFATWFGAETVLGASSEFVQHGILGVIEDPFGASLCLLLVGLFFARPLYRMNIISLGDFYLIKYGKKAELLSTVLMIISFFGWTAAQFIAFGLVLHFVTGISIEAGTGIGVVLIIIYTMSGGMWAVSLTDFIQTIVIIAGMIAVLTQLITITPDVSKVTNELPPDFLSFFPKGSATEWLNYIAAWFTIGLGSIASQDVFQRVMSTKSVKAARTSAFLGAFMYLTIAFIPLVIGLFAMHLDPGLMGEDTQQFLPAVVLKYSPIWVQVLFFGALLSAVLSSASAGVLAPSTLLAENIFRNIFPDFTEKKFLLALRISVVVVALLCYAVTFFRSNIFELVGESSALTLVSLFIPLVCGLILKKPHPAQALASMIFGLISWVLCNWFYETVTPAILIGLGVSLLAYFAVGMFLRSGSDQVSSL